MSSSSALHSYLVGPSTKCLLYNLAISQFVRGMKATTMGDARAESFLSDLMTLFKARLSLLVLITTLVGFLCGWRGPMDYVLLVATLIGTASSACGASALNQWWERELDQKMKRTRDRPLPAGRMHPTDALVGGLMLSFLGVFCLLFFVNGLSAGLALLTILSYVLVYTPLKTRTSLNTLVGAVPGALPPLLGWTAATGRIELPGIILFAILWFWQMPHFLAIAWLYREEYQEAGFKMLSGQDVGGILSARQSVVYSVYLTAISLIPVFLSQVAVWYFFAALLLGVGFTVYAVCFLQQRTTRSARNLFFASVIYLPLFLGVLLAARI